MAGLAEKVAAARSQDVVSMSLDAGFEIEDSRLNGRSNASIVHNFGQLLRKQTSLTPTGGGRGLANPKYVEPLDQLYLQLKDRESASLQALFSFGNELAERFETFSDELPEVEKTKLVEICAQLHELLSETNRGVDQDVEFSWRR